MFLAVLVGVYCSTTSDQYISYIQDENKFINIKKSGKGTVNQVNDFGLPLKKYGELDRD